MTRKTAQLLMGCTACYCLLAAPAGAAQETIDVQTHKQDKTGVTKGNSDKITAYLLKGDVLRAKAVFTAISDETQRQTALQMFQQAAQNKPIQQIDPNLLAWIKRMQTPLATRQQENLQATSAVLKNLQQKDDAQHNATDVKEEEDATDWVFVSSKEDLAKKASQQPSQEEPFSCSFRHVRLIASVLGVDFDVVEFMETSPNPVALLAEITALQKQMNRFMPQHAQALFHQNMLWTGLPPYLMAREVARISKDRIKATVVATTKPKEANQYIQKALQQGKGVVVYEFNGAWNWHAEALLGFSAKSQQYLKWNASNTQLYISKEQALLQKMDTQQFDDEKNQRQPFHFLVTQMNKYADKKTNDKILRIETGFNILILEKRAQSK